MKNNGITMYMIALFSLLTLVVTINGTQSSNTAVLGQEALVNNNQSEETSNHQQEQKNKEVVIAMTDAFNSRNATALDDLIAQDIIERRPGAGQGIESTKGFLAALAQAFPDFNTKIDNIVAQGDLVVVFTNTTGTHEGKFIFAPGTAPTGKEVSFTTADLYRLKDGKIVEHSDVIEILNLMAKIGAISFNNTPPQ